MKILVSALALAAVVGAAAPLRAEEPEGPRPYATKVLSCERVVLTWTGPAAGWLLQTPASVVTVESKAGTTGMKFWVDRSR
ncbi:MAG TPA: hypothetical protein VMV18_10230, partial [bacterium]|nr:hypothetical protein [bacterium]